jgi:hypothetical protein
LRQQCPLQRPDLLLDVSPRPWPIDIVALGPKKRLIRPPHCGTFEQGYQIRRET